MLTLNGRFPKVTDVKTKKLCHNNHVPLITSSAILFFVAERMILVVSLNYQTFFGGDDDKATIQNYVLFKTKKSKNLSLSTIVQTPLQSVRRQMVRLTTCHWNTVCRFALFVCWTKWNRHHLLASSHFCSNLQTHFFKLNGRCWLDRGSLSLCRFGFAQTCRVCSLRWGVLPSPFSSLFQRKVSMPGCGWIRVMGAGSCCVV